MMAENRSAKGMRARRWATIENKREIIFPQGTNKRIHYDFKPDENMYPTCEIISIYFPLTVIGNFFM